MNSRKSNMEWRVCFDIPEYCGAIYCTSESGALATMRDVYDGLIESAFVDGIAENDDKWINMIHRCTCWIERFIGESQEEYDNEDMWETACEDETDDYLKSIGWKKS